MDPVLLAERKALISPREIARAMVRGVTLASAAASVTEYQSGAGLSGVSANGSCGKDDI